MPVAFPGNNYSHQTAISYEERPTHEELASFEKMWLAHEAYELKKAHHSAIAGHLLTLSLRKAGSDELFYALETELLRDEQQKLKLCDAVQLLWIVRAFQQKGTGSSLFFNALHERLLADNALLLRQYDVTSLRQISEAFAHVPFDTLRFYELVNEARKEQLDLWGR